MFDFVHYNFFLLPRTNGTSNHPKDLVAEMGMTAWEIGKNWRGNSTGGQLDGNMEIFCDLAAGCLNDACKS